ncbi:MAG: TonB-dependent receptor [Phenylobacterium sp.]|uniref:TonB-dependent receptor plug domain-containing protein n=1 Tax=Phenylobacterium sp. TaxID=1871053 RepID=UPI001A393892|nr:TonB-dependent receptor [Phenylobacterium sp.]MBL8774259.1 TonB-dependent receptor [Phenylobacterium sp.]
MGRIGAGRSAWLRAASLAVLGGSLAAPALAQAPSSPAPPAPDAAAPGATSFPAAFFAPYNPVTAADMVARVPGFELRDGDERRGFGATAGNLLINGERPSSKTLAAELLKRIPAGSVVRIELLSGSDAAVDVRGQAQIVNVVVSEAGRRGGSTTYTVGVRHIQYSNRVGWVGQASRSIALAPNAVLALDVQLPTLLGRGDVRERLTTGPGAAPAGARRQLQKPQNIGITGAANLRWQPTPRDSVNLSFQAAPTWNTLDIIQAEVSAQDAPRQFLLGRSDFDRNFTAEFGGDWERRFDGGLSLKLITLVSATSVDQHDRFEIQTFPNAFLTRTQDRSTRGGERIVRGQLKWTASKAHTLEVGAEGAFNYRDTTLDIANQPRGGPVVPVPLAVSDARVEETRGEVFASDIWTLSPRLTLESGVNLELSRIAQTGDQRKQRSFRFVKPRVSGTYALGPDASLRFSLLRDVAQLDFAEFSSAVDFVNTSTIQGNPGLVPEKAWKARVEWERRFGARTALTVAAFADRVQDVHDLVDIGGFDAYGNIGDGSRIGVEVRGAMPLAAFGLPNAELRFNGLYQRTRVTDPVTGERREFSVPLERQGSASGAPVLNAGNKRWAYVLNFRQNLPELSSSWGAALVQWSGRKEYRRAELYAYERPQPRLDLFVETTALKPVTVRVFANNVLGPSEDRTRTFFQGSRASGVVQRAEVRVFRGGPEGTRSLGLQVSGRF